MLELFNNKIECKLIDGSTQNWVLRDELSIKDILGSTDILRILEQFFIST
jgi:hypothetical protein